VRAWIAGSGFVVVLAGCTAEIGDYQGARSHDARVVDASDALIDVALRDAPVDASACPTVRGRDRSAR
jgi:hypothetical protein